MNGPQHYVEAERLLSLVADMQVDPRDAIIVASAQVHATLALVAAQVDTNGVEYNSQPWTEAIKS